MHYEKQKEPGHTNQFLHWLQHLLVMYYLTKFHDVI